MNKGPLIGRGRTAEIYAWQAPTMAARLNEDIPGEHGKLLRLIEESLTENATARE